MLEATAEVIQPWNEVGVLAAVRQFIDLQCPLKMTAGGLVLVHLHQQIAKVCQVAGQIGVLRPVDDFIDHHRPRILGACGGVASLPP